MILTYEKYKKREDQLKNDKNNMCKLIDEYIILNGDKYLRYKRPVGDLYPISNDAYLGCVNFVEIKKLNSYVLSIDYYYTSFNGKKEKAQKYLDSDDFDDFKKFLRNPEVYKSIKKYNL